MRYTRKTTSDRIAAIREKEQAEAKVIKQFFTIAFIVTGGLVTLLLGLAISSQFGVI